MGQNLLVPLDSTVDLGQHYFLRKKKSNVQTFTVDHYLELTIISDHYLDLSRTIPMVYPSVQDFLSCFSPIIFDLSCFIRANLYFLSVQDSVPIPSCIFILFYLCLSRTISVTYPLHAYPLHRHVADKTRYVG